MIAVVDDKVSKAIADFEEQLQAKQDKGEPSQPLEPRLRQLEGAVKLQTHAVEKLEGRFGEQCQAWTSWQVQAQHIKVLCRSGLFGCLSKPNRFGWISTAWSSICWQTRPASVRQHLTICDKHKVCWLNENRMFSHVSGGAETDSRGVAEGIEGATPHQAKVVHKGTVKRLARTPVQPVGRRNSMPRRKHSKP